MESSAVAHFQWSVSRLIGQWSIKRKSHPGCLYFLVIPCNRTVWSDIIRRFGWWYQSFLLSLVDRLLFILFETDLIRCLPVPTPHLRHHHDDCVLLNRSQLGTEGKTRICGPLLPKIYVLFGFVFLRHFVHLAGTHTDRATKYDRIPTQVCSCLREVLSALTIWPWTSTKLLNSSCIKH